MEQLNNNLPFQWKSSGLFHYCQVGLLVSISITESGGKFGILINNNIRIGRVFDDLALAKIHAQTSVLRLLRDVCNELDLKFIESFREFQDKQFEGGQSSEPANYKIYPLPQEYYTYREGESPVQSQNHQKYLLGELKKDGSVKG